MKTKLVIEVEVFDPKLLKERAWLVSGDSLEKLSDQLFEVLRSEEAPLDAGFEIIDWRVE